MQSAQQSIVECRVSCDKELAGARHAVAVIIRVSLLNLLMMLRVMLMVKMVMFVVIFLMKMVMLVVMCIYKNCGPSTTSAEALVYE